MAKNSLKSKAGDYDGIPDDMLNLSVSGIDYTDEPLPGGIPAHEPKPVKPKRIVKKATVGKGQQFNLKFPASQAAFIETYIKPYTDTDNGQPNLKAHFVRMSKLWHELKQPTGKWRLFRDEFPHVVSDIQIEAEQELVDKIAALEKQVDTLYHLNIGLSKRLAQQEVQSAGNTSKIARNRDDIIVSGNIIQSHHEVVTFIGDRIKPQVLAAKTNTKDGE